MFQGFFHAVMYGKAAGGSFFVFNIHQGIEKRGCLIQFCFLCPDTRCHVYRKKSSEFLRRKERRGKIWGHAARRFWHWDFCTATTK